jgi:hypothetical protein
MLPVLLVLNVLVSMMVTDFKAGCNMVSKEQANYNSYIGLYDGLKRYSSLAYSGFRISIYYLDYENDKVSFSLTEPVCKDYAKIKVSYVNSGSSRTYTLDSIGYFNGCVKENLKKFSD